MTNEEGFAYYCETHPHARASGTAVETMARACGRLSDAEQSNLQGLFRAALLALAENVTDEMVVAFIETDRNCLGHTREGRARACITAALREAAEGGDDGR